MNARLQNVFALNSAAAPVASRSPGHRRILCVFPRYTPSFGTFEYSYGLTMGTRAFMPPQGILLIAAALPKHWQVRFIDENMEPATDRDFAWADAVFVSGMHIQRRQIDDICSRAHRFGKVTVLGGPSVSSCPEYYPSFDYLHVGEAGDATDDLIAILSHDIARPDQQVVLKTKVRRELSDLPAPAYELAKVDRYLLGSIQFSSGCPYKCEFCDIPGLYGRVPRLKTPEQILSELDKLLEEGVVGTVYFVDDNFIANRKAVAELLPHLIGWQKKRGYPVGLSCEATLNIARTPEILAMMREAGFETIFCGIETPEADALKEIDKKQNLAMPILDSVRAINQHGMQVVSGIILGLDSDTPDTGQRLLDFIAQSQIPMLTINLLQALPQTPLWDRLAKADRLVEDEGREFERALPPALRQGRGDVEAVHGRSLSAGDALWPLPISNRKHLAEPAEAAGKQGAARAEEHPARSGNAHQDFLDAWRASRLSPQLLEIYLALAEARRSRIHHRDISLRASSRHVRTRCLRWPHQCLALCARAADAGQRGRAADRRGRIISPLPRGRIRPQAARLRPPRLAPVRRPVALRRRRPLR